MSWKRSNVFHACIHTHIHVYIHTYMHTYTHTCIHTHIHARVQGIVELHDAGIVFLDLKPSNLFFDQHDYLVIGDFGLAKVLFVYESRTNPTSAFCV